MSDGRVIWWCGKYLTSNLGDGSTGKQGVTGMYCTVEPSSYYTRHARDRYGCGWYVLSAIDREAKR